MSHTFKERTDRDHFIKEANKNYSPSRTNYGFNSVRDKEFLEKKHNKKFTQDEYQSYRFDTMYGSLRSRADKGD